MNRRGNNFEKPIYGREREVSELINIIRKTEESHGGVLFLKGEAGIGKTTLLRKAEEFAHSRNFQIMHGWCLPESLEPLLPIKEALISANLEELYTGEGNPRIEGLYLIDPGGIPMAKAERKEFAIDSDIFASMISAVGEFLKDSMNMMNLEHGNEDARSMSYGDYRIVIESGAGMNIAALIKGRENEFLLADLSELIENLRGEMKKHEDWSGDKGEMIGVTKIMNEFLVSGHYDGNSYGAADPRLRRSHLFENILMGLRRYSSKKPVIMVLDDLQWADPSTLSLVHYLARNMDGLSVSIIGAYRQEDVRERKHPLIETVRLMNREGLLKEMKIERLTAEETLKLTGGSVPGLDEEELAGLSKALYSITDGNPFFILETLDMMKKGGQLREDAEGWKLETNAKELDIPPRVYDIMMRKLDQLNDKEKDLMEKASVFGLEFRPEKLACLDLSDLMEVASLVRNIERNYGIIVAKGDSYRFDHSTMREMIYAEIPPVIRKSYHLKAAECLVDTGRDGDIGMQFYLAGDSRGVEYLIRAAEDAKSNYSNQEAIREYEMAHAICLSEERKLYIMEELGDLYSITGSNERALQIYEEVFRHKGGSEETVAEAINLITKISEILDKLGRYDGAINWIERGEELLNSANRDVREELGRLLLARGNIIRRRGDLKGAENLLEKAINIFLESGNNTELPRAYLTLGLIIKSLGDYETALKYMLKSAENSEKNRDETTVARTYNSIGSIYGESGDEERALQFYKKALAISEKIGDLWNISGSYNNIGLAFAMAGDSETAIKYYERALKIARKIGELRGATLLYNNLGGLQYEMGRLDDAIKNYAEGLKISRSIGAKWEEMLTMNNLGEVYRTIGRLQEAENIHRDGLKIAEDMGEKMLEVFHRCGLAEAHIERGFKEGDIELIDTGIKEAETARELAEEIEIKDAVALTYRICGEAYLFKEEMEKSRDSLLMGLRAYKEMERKTDAAICLYLLSLVEKDRSAQKEAELLIGEENWNRWKRILDERWEDAGTHR